ncbi:hypothetical protein [uncultured Porphyromonas sp.]|uniref:hypothetical protein n=1 Tax=uncultured Porphyromonas sp. TaxID=159274 RepID=UPI002611B0B2|nr:hypothetical protein [uncultured Porphyromonas sp.]
MVKRFYSSISVAMLMGLLLATLTSCGGKDPKEVAEEAVNAELKGDLETLYGLLSQEDKDAMTLENFKSFYTIPDELSDAIELLPEVKESIKVDKFTSSVNGETATVTYFIYLPDLEKIGSLSLEDAKQILSMKSHRLKDLPEDIQNKIKESVQKDGVPTRSYDRSMNLKREGDEWRVFMDLANQVNARMVKSVYVQNN